MHHPSTPGVISTPHGTLPQNHELDTARVLIRTGYHVKFLPVKTTKSPDIHFRGYDWEIKCPTGHSSRTLENNLRAALRQAPRVILDLRRIGIPEAKCLSYLQTHLHNFRELKHLLIITHSEQILSFTIKNSKTTCQTPLPMLQ